MPESTDPYPGIGPAWSRFWSRFASWALPSPSQRCECCRPMGPMPACLRASRGLRRRAGRVGRARGGALAQE
jgi:hypothetical protein